MYLVRIGALMIVSSSIVGLSAKLHSIPELTLHIVLGDSFRTTTPFRHPILLGPLSLITSLALRQKFSGHSSNFGLTHGLCTLTTLLLHLAVFARILCLLHLFVTSLNVLLFDRSFISACSGLRPLFVLFFCYPELLVASSVVVLLHCTSSTRFSALSVTTPTTTYRMSSEPL